MRAVSEYPAPINFDQAFFQELLDEAKEAAKRAGDWYSFFDLAKLAYQAGHDRCGSITGWD